MKIREKFTLFSFLLVIISIAGVSILFYFSEKQLLTNGIRDKEAEMAQTFVQISEDALRVNDELPVLNYVATIRKTKGVAYALLVDKNNTVLAHTDGKLIGKKGTEACAADGITELSLPVMAGREQKGTARIGFSKSVMDEIITASLNRTRNRIAYIALIILIAGLAGAAVLSRRMTRPIKKLSEGAISIGEGNLDYRINIDSKDEIGDLSREFNLMARKLQELDQLKKDFVSSVSHELRSPLTAIEGYVDYFVDIPPEKVDKEKWQKALNIMKKNTSRLNNFIGDILDMAKIEAAQFEIDRTPSNLYPVAEEITALFEKLAVEKKVAIKLDIPRDLPEVMIDADKIKQVFTNLVSNALKFTPEGGTISIQAKCQAPSPLSSPSRGEDGPAGPGEGGFLEISISDTGIGIPVSALEYIFDRFRRAPEITDRIKKTKGTGLGLSITKGIIELHGGKIWAESELNKGSVFHFTLERS